jgi:hypothetical protein
MKGSCAAPPGPQALWSLFSPQAHIPQGINGWKRSSKATDAPAYVCPKSFNLTLTNCFSFACKRSSSVKGVPVAACKCPLGEFDGAVAPGTPFVTQAGRCNKNIGICASDPVAGIFNVDDITPGECINF